MTTGMFLGRFQPFHKGHLEALKRVFDTCDKGFIVLGSANVPPNKENPYSVFERECMVRLALEEAGLMAHCEIYRIDDIPDDFAWVDHVERHVPAFTHVFSGEGLHFDLFKASKKYQMVELPRIFDLYATKIRDAISRDEPWEEFVLLSVAEEMKRMGLWRISSF